MAIPSNPSVSDIVTEGLKRGGRVNPSAGDITNGTTHQFQEVKADIYLKAPQHHTLLTQSIAATTNGISRYSRPAACEAMRSIQLIDAPTEGDWRGTAQTGGASSITLSASFSADENNVIGRFVFITSGTGSGQFGQITAYNNSTKVATLETAWATLDSTWVSPNSTSVYLVEGSRAKLWDSSKPTEWDTLVTPFTRGTPTRATTVGTQVWLNYTPDRVYVLLYDYWQALDRLDEALTPFLNHLRKFRNIWIQGIAVKTMQRYDEDRYQLELGVYERMLDMYGSVASNVGQVIFRDVE
jgi:hypothetical protein